MAQVVYSRNAISNLDRLHRFLAARNPEAAARAVNTILDRLKTLKRVPRLGPADPERPDIRELFMPFGAAGYVARYRVLGGTVVVLAVRHMREAGYSEPPPTPPPPAPSSRRRRS
jgi:plasmid stabilization system protein ParE